MKTVILSSVTCITLFVCALVFYPQLVKAGTTAEQAPGCALAAQVLESVSRLKPGMARADVEKDFEADGGLSMRDRTTYTYRHCHYIKIDVEFRMQEGGHANEGFSPSDLISRVSSPYLAYPVSD
jgi:hypothetical protein